MVEHDNIGTVGWDVLSTRDLKTTGKANGSVNNAMKELIDHYHLYLNVKHLSRLF